MEMTPLLLLGLLVAILTGTGTVSAQTETYSTTIQVLALEEDTLESPDDDMEMDSEDQNEGSSGDGNDLIAEAERGALDPMASEHDGDGMPPYMIIVPVALILLIVLVIAAFLFSRRRQKQKIPPADVKEEEFLAGCDAEKVPTPMFEEDVPSVLELEMEDLDKWAVKADSPADATGNCGKDS